MIWMGPGSKVIPVTPVLAQRSRSPLESLMGSTPPNRPEGSLGSGDVADLRDSFNEVGRRRPRARPAGETQPADPLGAPVDREGRARGRQRTERIIQDDEAEALMDPDHRADTPVQRADDGRENRPRRQESGYLGSGTAVGAQRWQQ